MIRKHVVLSAFVVLSVARAALAGTFFVNATTGNDANSGAPNAPFATIQRAIDEADESVSPGADTIVVAPGTYVEALEIEDADQLILRGSGVGLTVVTSGSDDDDVIEIEGGDVRIRNLTITGGDRGVDADDMDNFEFSDAEAVENDGDGVRVRDSGTVDFRDATISGNNDGMDLEDNGEIRVQNVTCEDNNDDGLEVDDCDSIYVLGGLYSGNADDGIDLDTVALIGVVGVVSSGNGNFDCNDPDGNGLQVEAQDDIPIESVVIVNSSFNGNTKHGVEIVEELPATVESARLANLSIEGNGLTALNVVISGDSQLLRIVAADNEVCD